VAALMRRGRNRGLRRFRTRGGRPKTTWVTSIFNEQSLPLDGALQEFIVGLHADVFPSTIGMTEAQIQRTIVNAVVNMRPATNDGDSDGIAVVWALYVIDVEDSDGSLTDQSIFSTCRVLQTGVLGFTVQGVAVMAGGPVVYPGIPINVDVTMPVKLKPDDLLVFGVQLTSDSTVVDALSIISCTALSRVLYRVP